MTTNAMHQSIGRNPLHTPQHPGCRMCHYAGFSNICIFSQGEECPYVSLRKNLNAPTQG